MCWMKIVTLYMKVNKSMITLEEVTNKYDVQELKDMIQEHVFTPTLKKVT